MNVPDFTLISHNIVIFMKRCKHIVVPMIRNLFVLLRLSFPFVFIQTKKDVIIEYIRFQMIFKISSNEKKQFHVGMIGRMYVF